MAEFDVDKLERPEPYELLTAEDLRLADRDLMAEAILKLQRDTPRNIYMAAAEGAAFAVIFFGVFFQAFGLWGAFLLMPAAALAKWWITHVIHRGAWWAAKKLFKRRMRKEKADDASSPPPDEPTGSGPTE